MDGPKLTPFFPQGLKLSLTIPPFVCAVRPPLHRRYTATVIDTSPSACRVEVWFGAMAIAGRIIGQDAHGNRAFPGAEDGRSEPRRYSVSRALVGSAEGKNA